MNLNNLGSIEGIIETVLSELDGKSDKFPNFKSKHEAYAVMKQEFDTLWDDIKVDAPDSLLKSECVRIIASTLKMLKSDIWDKSQLPPKPKPKPGKTINEGLW